MSETAPDVPVEALDGRHAVYDEAELRFVGDIHDDKSSAAKAASDLNSGNDVGRADGKAGKRYTVRAV